VLLAASLYAAAGNAAKLIFRLGYSPVLLAQLRISFAFLWLLLALLIFSRRRLLTSRRELPRLAAFAIFAVLAVQLTYYLAISRLNIGVAVFVQYLGLVAVTVWERYRRRQKVAARVWGALALVLTGSFFMVGAYRASLFQLNLTGLILSLIAAGFFAAFLLGASNLVQRVDRSTVLVYGFGIGALAWLGIDLVTRPAFPSSIAIWGVMAAIGLVGTLVPYGLEVAALRRLRPTRVGIIATFEPVFAGLIAFGLGDVLEPLQVMGAIVTLTGIILVQAGQPESGVREAAMPA
jgi:drug/metabolite transporter (DMT)-like permease